MIYEFDGEHWVYTPAFQAFLTSIAPALAQIAEQTRQWAGSLPLNERMIVQNEVFLELQAQFLALGFNRHEV